MVSAVCFGLLAFVRCFFCWRKFKRLLFGLACLATLIALFYAEEDWRGWHAWNKFKHEWEAKGEHLIWPVVVPPPVPDDQNFAFSPVWIAEMKYNFLKTQNERRHGMATGFTAKKFPNSAADAHFGVRFDGNKLVVGRIFTQFSKMSGQWTMASSQT